jgi:hypothetical protein
LTNLDLKENKRIFQTGMLDHPKHRSNATSMMSLIYDRLPTLNPWLFPYLGVATSCAEAEKASTQYFRIKQCKGDKTSSSSGSDSEMLPRNQLLGFSEQIKRGVGLVVPVLLSSVTCPDRKKSFEAADATTVFFLDGGVVSPCSFSSRAVRPSKTSAASYSSFCFILPEVGAEVAAGQGTGEGAGAGEQLPGNEGAVNRAWPERGNDRMEGDMAAKFVARDDASRGP